eukprot:UN24346
MVPSMNFSNFQLYFKNHMVPTMIHMVPPTNLSKY